MHYWIDGYNLLFRITKNYRDMKQNERKLLAALNHSITLLRYQATVVFDGREKDPPEALRRNFDALALIYTPHHQTADDYILEALADAPDPSKETVVSSDYELLCKAKQRGARTQTIEEFLSKLVKKKHKKKAAQEKEFQESRSEIKRLLKIFEDRLCEE
ncbi:MAG TPA: NYN domain-containing protein [Rhabdochlamydiaceae bacterium]|nr:NYN domain-containing protein [Rhabdochlamydiaceae bacterium]